MPTNPYASPKEESRPKSARRLRGKHLATIALCFYLGSFLLFRAFPYRFDLAHSSDPQRYLVIFSFNTDLHCAVRAMYWPLIVTIPGHRYYPNREEHEILMRVKGRTFPIEDAT